MMAKERPRSKQAWTFEKFSCFQKDELTDNRGVGMSFLQEPLLAAPITCRSGQLGL
jgi:hypothetical protein